MNEVGEIMCGVKSSPSGVARVALDQISRSIADFSARSLAFLKTTSSPDMLSFGPFCARVVLENSCAALVGRLDSFRMLYLTEFQTRPEYEIGKRANSAFCWTGDVIPEEKAPNTLWSTDHERLKISRALFSKHFEHIYWKPAVDKMLDFVSSLGSDFSFQEILSLESATYVNVTRGKSLQLYSSLSKGVHWEFFSSALVFDEETIKDLIRDTLLLVGHLGLISHFIPTAYASLSPREAVDRYVKLRVDVG